MEQSRGKKELVRNLLKLMIQLSQVYAAVEVCWLLRGNDWEITTRDEVQINLSYVLHR